MKKIPSKCPELEAYNEAQEIRMMTQLLCQKWVSLANKKDPGIEITARQRFFIQSYYADAVKYLQEVEAANKEAVLKTAILWTYKNESSTEKAHSPEPIIRSISLKERLKRWAITRIKKRSLPWKLTID